MKKIADKCVSWEVPALETLAGYEVYRLREKLNHGEKLSREEKNWITESVNNSVHFNDAVELEGYYFDFSDVLKTFVVYQYGYHREYKAIDRTSLRTAIYGHISRIVEV